MTTATLPPGFSVRGRPILSIIDPEHWAARPGRAPAPLEDGPQDDAGDPATSLGFRLYVYVAGLICATLGLIVLAGTTGFEHVSESDSFAIFGLAVLWAASFSGLIDYAVRGARR